MWAPAVAARGTPPALTSTSTCAWATKPSGNGNWDPSGAWDDRYPTTLLNSRTVSIEHHDNGGRTAGSGKGVVPEAVITASIALDALLLRGDLAEQKAAGIRFRAGTESAITRELRAIPVDRHHLIDHHYIAGRLKPSCWRPWADDPTGFPQARYLAALAPAPPTSEETVNSYPVPTVPSIASVPAGTWLYATSALEPSPDNICVDPGRDMPYLGQPASTVRIVEYVDVKGVHTGRAMFAKASEVPTPPSARRPTPRDPARRSSTPRQSLLPRPSRLQASRPRQSTGPERWRSSPSRSCSPPQAPPPRPP